MKKIFFSHNTCLNSAYDLNVVRAGLEREGFELVDRPEDADEIIYSGCSVREKWVDDAISQLNEAGERSPKAKINVTGCVANTSAEYVLAKTSHLNPSFMTMAEILRQYTGLAFSEVDQSLSQNYRSGFESGSVDGLENMRQRVGAEKASLVAELQEIDRRFGTEVERYYRQRTKGFVFYDEIEPCEMITVTRSCLYRCSFCNIPQGRGDFESVPLADVIEKARKAIGKDKFHIVLIGDEVGNYRSPGSYNRLPELVDSLLSLHPDIKISIRYIEPKPLLKFAKNFIKWCKNKKIHLLYVSIQSGSERTLKAMNRGYDLGKVVNVLEYIRKTSSVVFYGNWLVGFPGEKESDFQETVSLLKKLDFHINVAIPFSARENTPAFDMPGQINKLVINDRVAKLEDVAADIKASMMGSVLDFLDEGLRGFVVDRIRQAELSQYVVDQKSYAVGNKLQERIEVKQL